MILRINIKCHNQAKLGKNESILCGAYNISNDGEYKEIYLCDECSVNHGKVIK